MHHRRKRTTRRENKRNSRKQLRGAEREAMNGHGNLNRETPIVNEEPRHRKMTRKRTPKKTKCPKGGTHSWERSIVERQEFYREEIRDCARCAKLHADWDRRAAWYNARWGSSDLYKGENPYAWEVRWNRCRDHGPKVYYIVTETFRTCTKCATKQRVDVDNDRWDGYRRNKKLVLPRRQVKLY